MCSERLQTLTKLTKSIYLFAILSRIMSLLQTLNKTDMKINLIAAATLLLCAGCSSNGNSDNNTAPNLDAESEITAGNTSGGGSESSVSSCSDDIAEGSAFDILTIPPTAESSYQSNFCKYTELLAPNGKRIAFYAQNRISNEQLIRARSILEFYLTDLPGSTYGNEKFVVFNQMANNNATMILLNGSDDGEPPADGQTLYETENVVEGSPAYLTNNPRDAAFEEILHLMHDTGIGVDGANTQAGVAALAPFQLEIRAATENAISPGIITSDAAQLGIWATNEPDWLQELSRENSLTQEYLASVIDTYYGLAGESSAGGFNDIYQPQTRAEIRTTDPMGWALVDGDSTRQYFSEYVTYDARIDGTFDGTFTLTFDANTLYTHKSQYLVNAQLTGSGMSNLVGNAQNNQLVGNRADNQITGGQGDDNINGNDGLDIALFSGSSSEYTVSTIEGITRITDSVADRDGSDTLENIEMIQFADTVRSL